MKGRRLTGNLAAAPVVALAVFGFGFWSAISLSPADGRAAITPPTTVAITLPPITVPTLTTVAATTVAVTPPPPPPPPPPKLPDPPPLPAVTAVSTTVAPAPAPAAPAGAPGPGAPPAGGAVAGSAVTAAASSTGLAGAGAAGAITTAGAAATPGPSGRPAVGVGRSKPSRRGPGARQAAVVTVRLGRPARLVLVVRGPAPSCAEVGRRTVRGTRGVNRVRLGARLNGRRLADGLYRVSVVRVRAGRRSTLGTVHVRVRGRAALPASPRALDCSLPVPAAGPGAPYLSALLGRPALPPPAAGTGAPATPATEGAAGVSTEVRAPRPEGALATLPVPSLPEAIDGGGPRLAVILTLALLFTGALYAGRLLRRSRHGI